jgi:uncharacterized protein (TIGR00369 family)
VTSAVISKTYGTVSAASQNEMSGLEFVQGLVNGTLPLNMIARTLGYDVIEAVKGRVVVAVEPSEAHLNPYGTVHGGLTATLLDSCMGLAVQSTLEKGFGQTTVEFKISLLRPTHKGGRHCVELRSTNWDCGRASHRRQRTLAGAWHDHMPYFRELMSAFGTKQTLHG